MIQYAEHYISNDPIQVFLVMGIADMLGPLLIFCFKLKENVRFFFILTSGIAGVAIIFLMVAMTFQNVFLILTIFFVERSAINLQQVVEGYSFGVLFPPLVRGKAVLLINLITKIGCSLASPIQLLIPNVGVIILILAVISFVVCYFGKIVEFAETDVQKDIAKDSHTALQPLNSKENIEVQMQ